MNNKRYLAILLFLSTLTHFIFLGHPNQVVFDEVHFGGFISHYYANEYFFDIHPPLGKLLVAGVGALFGFVPEYSFSMIGNDFPDNGYILLRFLPTLAGTLFPGIIFLLLIELGFKPKTAFIGGLLMVFENTLLTESRLILLNPFLLTFGFSSLWAYLKYRNSNIPKYLLFSAILGALAISIKWTGVAFIGLVGLFEIFNAIKNKSWKTCRYILLYLVVTPFLIYFSIMAIHFSLLTKSGPGDAFMSLRFQKTLEGNQYQKEDHIKPISLFGKFIELNKEMYRSNQRLEATHPYSSAWYSWPFMNRTIYYWVREGSRIYLIGNPIIWWASSIGIIALLSMLLFSSQPLNFTTCFIALGYLSNMLPFVGVKRLMFLYHYLPALIFAVIALLYLLEKQKKSQLILNTLLVSAIALFLYFAPLSYGLQLTDSSYENRVWVESWK